MALFKNHTSPVHLEPLDLLHHPISPNSATFSRIQDTFDSHADGDSLEFRRELAFFIFTCFAGTFLCMLFGCRVNVLRCQTYKIKNPPMVFAAMVLSGILMVASTLLSQHLSSYGFQKACYASSTLPVFLLIINKYLVFLYFAESLHAIRACQDCTLDRCKWYTRWSIDWYWSSLAFIATFGCMAEMIHASIKFGNHIGRGTIVDGEACVVMEDIALVIHLFTWHIAFSILLLAMLLVIGACTMRSFPQLHDVATWQYRIRSVVSKVLPTIIQPSCEEPVGSDCLVKCPAYLVLLNGRTAGLSERLALTSAFSVILTILPTSINLSILCWYRGQEWSWIFLMLNTFDGEVPSA